MITNLVASVALTLVTNTAERFPTEAIAVPCPDKMPSGISCAALHYKTIPKENPTEKWIDTEILSVTTVIFDHQGKRHGSTNSVSVTNWTEHFVLKQGWEKK